jgi:hypothetical protein
MVFSVVVNPVRPSPPLQRHAGHCDDIPDVVEAHGDRTSPRPPLYLVRPPVDATLEPARGRRPDSQPLCHHPRIRSCTSTGLATNNRQLRGTARHAFTRRIIVRHACKLLSPWPIKGGPIPQPQGGRQRRAALSRLWPLTPILAFASINTSGTWRTSLLSRLACSTPLQAPQCDAI